MTNSDIQVVFVDDDGFFSQPWVAELRTEWCVQYIRTAEGAISYIRNVELPILLILDVQMPPPNIDLTVETDNGQTTGVWILSQCAEALHRTQSGVILLTNVDVREVQKRLRDRKLEWLNSRVVSKSSATPGVLLTIARECWPSTE